MFRIEQNRIESNPVKLIDGMDVHASFAEFRINWSWWSTIFEMPEVGHIVECTISVNHGTFKR